MVAEKLRQRLSQLSVGEQEGITMSFGLVEYHLSESQSQLMVRVDRALYQAKLSGKNQLCGWH
ncbi:diguanylate cyclase [compost metagenome]